MHQNRAPNHNFSSNIETKKHVTPFAFGIADSLLGAPLAGPGRRLVAIIVDLVIVGLLTTVNALLLALIVLLLAIKILFGLRAEPGRFGVKAALSVVALVSALVIVGALAFSNSGGINIEFSSDDVAQPAVQSEESPDLVYRNDQLNNEFSLRISDLQNEKGLALCPENSKCDQQFSSGLTRKLLKEGYDYQEASGIFSDVHTLLKEHERIAEEVPSSLSESMYKARLEGAFDEMSGASVLDWLRGITSDFGLSFGWAAIYFSVLTASWNGQTVGKKIMGIKVVRIDGEKIDLWESFGRYGGYGAGLATGLLGFMQIYWDANRQAIQDKISETLVVRLVK